MKINERGLGDIIDEACTLAFKITNDIKTEYSIERFTDVVEYLKDTEMSEETKLSFALLLVNSLCWMAQDKIKKNPENAGIWATIAQDMNKQRNIVIGELNGGTGIVTQKSY